MWLSKRYGYRVLPKAWRRGGAPRYLSIAHIIISGLGTRLRVLGVVPVTRVLSRRRGAIMAARGKITGYFSSNTGNGDGGEGGNGSRKRARIEGGVAAVARSYGTSKHAVGYKPAWEAEYPWLVPDFSDGKVSGMLCSVCKRHSTKNKYNKTTAWSESPCICLRKDSVRRHASSVQHSNAVELEKV